MWLATCHKIGHRWDILLCRESCDLSTRTPPDSGDNSRQLATSVVYAETFQLAAVRLSVAVTRRVALLTELLIDILRWTAETRNGRLAGLAVQFNNNTCISTGTVRPLSTSPACHRAAAHRRGSSHTRPGHVYLAAWPPRAGGHNIAAGSRQCEIIAPWFDWRRHSPSN